MVGLEAVVQQEQPKMNRKNWIRIVAYKIDANLGRCPRCIRTSLLFAAAVWVAFFVTYSLASGVQLLLFILGFLGTILTALWVTHLVVYAARSSTHVVERGRLGKDPGIDESRRALLPTFAKAFAGIALATALPRVASANSCTKSCPDGTSASKDCTDPKYATCRCWCTPHAACGCYAR